MYKVMLACEDHCEGWDALRETLRTDDVNEAIRKSEQHRDRLHKSWVEMVQPGEETPKMQYNMSASRGHSGIEGDFSTMDGALLRLNDYAQSFPGELIEVHITKIQ